MGTEMSYEERVKLWVAAWIGVLAARSKIDPEFFGPVKYSMYKGK